MIRNDRPTQAIVLAAGKSTRLAGAGDVRPKTLIDLGGVTPLRCVLDLFAASGILTTTVVVGYRGDDVRDAITGDVSAGRVTVVENDEWANSETAYSFACAARVTPAPLLLTYGDTLVTHDLLRRVLDDAAPCVAGVDIAPNSRADMKVRIEADRVVEIAKTIPEARADGESACIFKLDRTATHAILQRIGGRAEWFETVLNSLLSLIEVRVVPCQSTEWCEIDEPDDLDRAKQFAARIHRTGVREYGGAK